MENKMTAVEWLVKEVNSDCLNSTFIQQKLIDIAKAMEKDQIGESFIAGSQWSIFPDDTPIDKIAEQYYNETFKNK